MAIKISFKDTEFGVGDTIRLHQKIKESGKLRSQTFEGMVIAIKNREDNRSFTVRKIGEQKIGIERIFPLSSPFIDKIDLVKKGGRGIKKSKLYYIRNKSQQEIDKIYTRQKARKV